MEGKIRPLEYGGINRERSMHSPENTSGFARKTGRYSMHMPKSAKATLKIASCRLFCLKEPVTEQQVQRLPPHMILSLARFPSVEGI